MNISPVCAGGDPFQVEVSNAYYDKPRMRGG